MCGIARLRFRNFRYDGGVFQAALYGKFDETEMEGSNPVLVEDILTSDVFGAFRPLESNVTRIG